MCTTCSPAISRSTCPRDHGDSRLPCLARPSATRGKDRRMEPSSALYEWGVTGGRTGTNEAELWMKVPTSRH